MSFPHINFKFTNTSTHESLRDLIEQKLHSLDKYFGESTVLCDVEFEKMTAQQHGDIFRVETNLTVDGKLYRADASMENFEKAIDEVRDELDKELRRASGKRETLFKRGGRKIKEMLRFGQ